MKSRTGRGVAFGIILGLSACTPTPDRMVSSGPDHSLGDIRTSSGSPDFSIASARPLPAPGPSPLIESGKIYALPQLIDIAQRNNPATAAAWERARAAALAAGEVEATYLPQLSANILAGYERTSQFLPAVPELDIPSGRLTATGAQFVPNLVLEWLLFDFGVRDAAREAAVGTTTAANAAFYEAHQRVMFEVTEAYFQYAAARAETAINRTKVADAETLRAVVEGRLKEGLATSVEAAQARQIQARAHFDLTVAEGHERNSHASLMRTMGLSPSTQLEVADTSGRRLPKQVPEELDTLIETSLARRPDVQVALAAVQASQAGIDIARAERLPRILATAEVGHVTDRYRLRDSRLSHSSTLRSSRPEAVVGLVVRIPLFDGGLGAYQERQARARAVAAQHDLEALRLSAALEIVQTYNLLSTSLAAYTSSGALLDASETTYRAALGRYENGLANLAEVSEARNALADARLLRAEAYSDALVAAAALAFTTGGFTNRDIPANW